MWAEFQAHGAAQGVLLNSIIFDHDLSTPVRLAMLAMTCFADGDRLRCTQYHLAKRMGISRQALSKTMTEAVKAGLLQRLEIDGEVVWRMRWMSFKRQPTVDTQRQPTVDSQPTVDAPRTRTHAQISRTPLSTSTTTRKKKTVETIPLSAEERIKFHVRFERFYPSAERLDEVIDTALEHKNANGVWQTQYRYVLTWLIRDTKDRKLFTTNLAAAEARLVRAKTPYGAPQHDPKVSEPAPFLTHSSNDLPPFHDYTKD